MAPGAQSPSSAAQLLPTDFDPAHMNLTDEDINHLAEYLRPYLEKHQYSDPSIDPVGWVRHKIGHNLTDYQEEIIRAPFEHRRTTIPASQDLGKSYSVADAALAYFYAYDDAVVITTAPTRRQVEVILWGYIRNSHTRAHLPGEQLRTAVRIDDVHYMMGFATAVPENFQGIHSPHILVIVDEASGLNPLLEEAIEGMLTSEDCRLMLVGNPTKRSGMFFESFNSLKHLYHVLHLCSFDTPNFTLDGRFITTPHPFPRFPGHMIADPNVIHPDDRPDPKAWYRTLAGPTWVEERKLAWGESSPMYMVRVLGLPPEADEYGLIPVSWLDAATPCEHPVPNYPDPGVEVVAAVDVARYGSNESVLYLRYGTHIQKMTFWSQADTMESVGRIIDTLSDPHLGLVQNPHAGMYASRSEKGAQTVFRIDRIRIDVNGLGAGVYDRLRELDWPVEAFNSANRNVREGFMDRRAEAFWTLRELFENGEICNLTDEKTKSQLSTLRWRPQGDGKIQIESKEQMEKRSLPSPDRADALAMCMLPIYLVGTAQFVANPDITRRFNNLQKAFEAQEIDPDANPSQLAESISGLYQHSDDGEQETLNPRNAHSLRHVRIGLAEAPGDASFRNFRGLGSSASRAGRRP